MKIPDGLYKVSRRISCFVGLAALLAASVPPAISAASKDHRYQETRRSDKKHARRAVRRARQEEAQAAVRKDFSRDTSRLDHKIDSATVKVTDAKITGQKDVDA